MKKDFSAWYFIAAFLVLTGLIFFWVSMRRSDVSNQKYNNVDLAPAIADHQSGGLITVTSPSPGSFISSPVIVKGTASGSWFFEGSFPVEVRDSHGKVIGKGIATSTMDWMTTGFIPFKAVVSFSAVTAKTAGSIVFKRDNPSGDASNDQFVEMPVIFH